MITNDDLIIRLSERLSEVDALSAGLNDRLEQFGSFDDLLPAVDQIIREAKAARRLINRIQDLEE